VLAATNKVPEEAVQGGHLREDLYYRLNVFHVHLPPLRERKEDIDALSEALLGDLNRKHECRVTEVSAEVAEVFQRHDWPGNVRELRNVLERAVILAGEGPVGMQHLPAFLRAASGQPPPPERPAGDDSDSVTFRVGTTVDEAEKGLTLKTLEHTRNNKTRAAEILGISLKTLHNKLKEYGAN
jgi:DNA-binding NtrC family response regulator